MANKTELSRRQEVVSKVVWGLLLMTMGVLFMLENLGKIDLDLSDPGRFAARYAVDGDPETRWSSAFRSPQWITVDLGANVAISRVRINWQEAYAKRYAIEVSDDGETWRTVKDVAKTAEGVDDHEVAATGRYLRIHGTKRATPWGYSLWELEVYGPAGLISGGKPARVSSREGGANRWALFWPLLMIGAGLPALIAPKDGGDQLFGLLLTGFGVFFQLQKLALVHWTFAQTWPVLIMVAGLLLVAQALRQISGRTSGDSTGPGVAQ
ncbi:MAG TPA: discoidin domain-containing protein [Vicinamibacteria bacterium]